MQTFAELIWNYPEEKRLANFASSWFGTLAMFSRATVSVVGH